MTIRKFAEHYSMAWKESYQYLKKYGGISFLDECYEAEHTLSFDDAIEDLTRVCANNGGGLKDKEQIFITDTLLSGIVDLIIENKTVSVRDALDILYNSETYKKIIDTETGLYIQSADYNYEILEEELLDGKKL